MELHPGDLVLKKLTPEQHANAAGSGPLRFNRTVDPVIYRIDKRIGDQPFAYRLVDHGAPHKPVKFDQPVSRHMLIKLDMPELEVGRTRVHQRIEVKRFDPRENPHVRGWRRRRGQDAPLLVEDWYKGTIEGTTLDSRVKIRWDCDPERPEMFQLDKYRYRFLHGGPGVESEPRDVSGAGALDPITVEF